MMAWWGWVIVVVMWFVTTTTLARLVEWLEAIAKTLQLIAADTGRVAEVYEEWKPVEKAE